MTNAQREEMQEEHDLQSNPDVAEKIEWMKGRLGADTNEELISKALTLLYQAIELEDRGYKIGAWKDNLLSRDVVKYRIAREK